MKIFLALIFLSLFLAPPARAESEEFPRLVLNGCRVYQAQGAQAAVASWTKDGPLEGDTDLQDKIGKLSDAEASFGNFESEDFIKAREFDKRLKQVFFALNYRRGALFAKFLLYRLNGDGNWVVIDFDFDKDPEKILLNTPESSRDYNPPPVVKETLPR